MLRNLSIWSCLEIGMRDKMGTYIYVINRNKVLFFFLVDSSLYFTSTQAMLGVILVLLLLYQTL